MEIEDLKQQWNAVLDHLLAADRIAWLAFFDARLVSFDGETLVLNFSDVTKFGGDHDFTLARNPKHIALLKGAVSAVVGLDIEVVEE
jgi:hypothetical protein